MHNWLALLLLLSCTTTSKSPKIATWIAKSNLIAAEYTRAMGELRPEEAADLGFEEFADRTECMQLGSEIKLLAFLDDWSAKLADWEAKEQDVEVRTDLRILRQGVARHAAAIRIDRKYGDVSYIPLTRSVFQRVRQLVNEQSNPRQRRNGALRFTQYVFPAAGCMSLADYATKNFIRKDSLPAPLGKIYPPRSEVEIYLKESPAYMRGLKTLLEQSGSQNWQATWSEFARQVEAHDRFLRETILPKSRRDFHVPREIYAFVLQYHGVNDTPEMLARRARHDYKKLFAEFTALGKKVAQSRGWKFASPAGVIAELKKNQISKAEELRAEYLKNDRRLQDIITRHELVTLPASPLRIRLAGEAESKSLPVPHLLPPVLIGNTGERPEFVIPTAENGRLAFDDFSYPEAMLGLGAHEGRPGHDLQFSAMLDRGASIIRAYYAFNSANAEGWGLYAEEMIYPFVNDAEKFVLLQSRLHRIARMFLDPELNLKKSPPQIVYKILRDELGMSQAWADGEVRRYTTDDRGQATAYYYGLEKMRAARAAAEATLGQGFTEKCFHDFILSLGLLPLDEIIARSKSIRCT